MARFAYDVNTTRRYIDVHKQFRGGLKTVDTDDALGAVYLRQAENVSLSEFGFIEKRYGTFEKWAKTHTGTIQGYWEFKNHAIYAINNRFYKWNLTNLANTPSPVTNIQKETALSVSPNYNKDWRYPATVSTPGSFYSSTTGFGSQTTYRDMNAVNINDVLYIFTGHYPVYVKEINSTLYFFWFSVDIPTYNEIVVTGHNLLEDDYDKLYGFTTPNDYTPGTVNLQSNATKGSIQKIDYFPRLPFQMDGDTKGNLNFTFDYTIPFSYSSQAHSSTVPYRRLSLESVGFRTSGAGASNLDFTNVDLTNVTFEDIDNDTSTTVKKTLDGGYFFNKISTTNTEFTRTSKNNGSSPVTERWYEYNIEKSFTISKDNIETGTPLVIQSFKLSGATYDPTYTKNIFDNFNDIADMVTPSNVLPAFHNVKITPIATDGTVVTSSTITVPESSIVISNNQYEFNAPSGLLASDTIASYRVTLHARFNQEYNADSNGNLLIAPTAYDHEDFAFTFAKVSDITVVRNFSDVSNRLIDFSITDLLAGTFDFKVTFKVSEYDTNDGLYAVNNNSHTFSSILFDVSITPEKLTDFTFFQGDREAPIWTCNKVIEHYGKLMVWGSTEMPTAVFYSFPDRPTYFPSYFYLDFTNDTNEAIESVTTYSNILVAQTASRTWGIRGNSGLVDAPAPYIPFGINPTVGTIAYKSVRPVRNKLFFLSKQGVVALNSLYAVDESYNIDFVDRNIRDGVTVIQDPKAVGIQYDNQYWLNFPQNGITLRWYVNKKAWVRDKYQGWNEFNGVLKYQIRDGELEFITYLSQTTVDGSNLHLYKIGIDPSLPTDIQKPIKAILETSFLNQNYPFHHKNYKEAKLDFTLQNEYNKGRVAIFDGSSSAETGSDTIAAQLITVDLAASTVLKKNHRYRVDFYVNPQTDNQGVTTYDNVNVTQISIEGQTSYVGTNFTQLQVNNANIPSWEFDINNNLAITGAVNLEFTVDTLSTLTNSDYVVIRDVTYDDSLAFSTYVISENQTLNFDNSPGYNQATVDVDIDLTEKGRLGDWTFGESDFGDKVTAVKTIKLSGKGYNSKLYVEDLSRSKWTLESIGITYKMKRARSK